MTLLKQNGCHIIENFETGKVDLYYHHALIRSFSRVISAIRYANAEFNMSDDS